MVKKKELIESTKLQKKIQQEIEANRKKKVAIIFRGEAYRDATEGVGENIRNIGNKSTVKEQKEANNNHCDFIEKIKNKYDIDVDVFIDTQSTQYDYSLITDYKKRNIYVKNFAFHNDYCKTQMLSIQRAVNHVLVNENLDNYRSVLVLRNDLYIKPAFFELYNPFDEKVKFSFIIWQYKEEMKSTDFWHRGRTFDGHPRIGDILYFIPKRYFMFLNHFKSIGVLGNWGLNKPGWGHDAISFWNKIIPNFQYDFYVKTFHESNPAIDLNPLYYMVNRKIADKYLTRQDKTYPENWDEYF